MLKISKTSRIWFLFGQIYVLPFVKFEWSKKKKKCFLQIIFCWVSINFFGKNSMWCPREAFWLSNWRINSILVIIESLARNLQNRSYLIFFDFNVIPPVKFTWNKKNKFFSRNYFFMSFNQYFWQKLFVRPSTNTQAFIWRYQQHSSHETKFCSKFQKQVVSDFYLAKSMYYLL